MELTPTPRLDPDEHVEILQRQNAIKRELLRKSKECGIAFYRPHYYQHLFHSSRAKRRGLFAGNRYGKSKGGAAETVAWMLGERPWYKVPFDVLGVDHVLGKNRRVIIKHHHDGYAAHPLVKQGIPPWPTKQVVVCANWDKVHEIWTAQDADRPGKIWELLPRGFVKKAIKNHEGVIDELYGENGSLLKFMSVDAFKRNNQVAESSDWDRGALDEPAPRGLWKGIARGLVDRGGQGDFALTSLEEIWIYDYFVKPENLTSTEDKLYGVPAKDEALPDAKVPRECFTATIWDNPHLTDENIDTFELELDEDEKECRMQGVPLELSGLIYKEFKRDRHILTAPPDGWTDFHLPAKSCILHVRVDTHPVKPNAVLFSAVGPAEIPVCCNEIFRACDADTLCDLISSYIELTGCFLGSLKLDPSAWIKDPSTRVTSIAKTFMAHGLSIRPASKDLENGILITKSALKRDRVLFTPTCRRTLWEFSRYRYDPESGKPVDENDHMMENLYRLCIDRLTWFNPDVAAGFAIEDQAFTKADLSTNY